MYIICMMPYAGFLQLTSSVNVEYPWLLRPQPVRPVFDLTVPSLKFSGRNSSRFDMRVCTRWRSGTYSLYSDVTSVL